MIDTKLRKVIQTPINFFSKGLIRLKISPNMLTVAALILGVVASVFVALDYVIAALALLWLSGLLDVFDGSVARLIGKSSKLGGYIDLIFDKIVEVSIILGFYFAAPQNVLAYLLFYVVVILNYSTFAIAGALFDNDSLKSMKYEIGLMERTETFITFSLMLIFKEIAFIILMTFNALVLATGIIRFIRIVRYSRKL